MSIETTNLILVGIILITLIFLMFAVNRILHQNWRNNVLITASDYIAELEKLRLKGIMGTQASVENIITLQSRLRMLLSRKKYANTLETAEQLRNMADKESSSLEYSKREETFTRMISKI